MTTLPVNAALTGVTITDKVPVKKFTLDIQHELRIEADDDVVVILTLRQGTAELFGTELAKGRKYKLQGLGSFAIFSWHGCLLEVKGKLNVAYTSGETPMLQYANFNAELEKLRDYATRSATSGPRVLIVGAADSGRSTVANILLAYAVRCGRHPVFIDLDVGDNSISIPGCVSAAPTLYPPDIEYGMRFRVPINFFFGHIDAVENKEHYEMCVKQLSEVVQKRAKAHPEDDAAGIIVDTISWIDGDGYKLLLKTAELLDISIIAVNGNDRLLAQLKEETSLKNVEIFKFTKSGGVVVKDATARRKARDRRIRKYFYGVTLDLSPHKSLLYYSDIGVFEVGGLPQAPSSALPIGETRLLEPNRILPVTPGRDFLHSILAVSQAKDPEHLLTAPIAGFIYVSALDTKKKLLTMLAPCSGPLPARCTLHGTLKWFD